MNMPCCGDRQQTGIDVEQPGPTTRFELRYLPLLVFAADADRSSRAVRKLQAGRRQNSQCPRVSMAHQIGGVTHLLPVTIINCFSGSCRNLSGSIGDAMIYNE